MPVETNFLLSSVTQRDTSVPGENDFEILIRFRLFKVTRNCSCIEAPEPIVDDEANFVMENQASVLSSSFKQLRYRPYYRQVMAQVLSAIGVPGHEHEAIVNKLFEVVKVAVPELPIIVGLGDVTVRFWDSNGNASDLSSEDVTVQRCVEDLQEIIDWLTSRDPMDENSYESLIPATKSAIDGLEKVKLDTLDEEAGDGRVPLCSICMEGLDQGSTDDITSLPCSHLYHGDCISLWLKRNRLCPVCRKPIEEEGKPSKGLLRWPSMLLILSAVGMTTVGLLSGLLKHKLKVKQDLHQL
ncbi:hypothetical protein ACLB2K_043908 [Fragaria x ananassa]